MYCLFLTAQRHTLLPKDFDADDPQYYAEDSLLLRALQQELFKDDEDVGVECSKDFDPMPLPTLALLLTCVRTPPACCHTFRLILSP